MLGLTPVENDIRCLKYEIKRLKERPIVENIAPAAVEETYSFLRDEFEKDFCE